MMVVPDSHTRRSHGSLSRPNEKNRGRNVILYDSTFAAIDVGVCHKEMWLRKYT